MPNHRCDVDDLDYSEVDLGRIHCTVCGREWILTGDGWVMVPREPAPRRRSSTT